MNLFKSFIFLSASLFTLGLVGCSGEKIDDPNKEQPKLPPFDIQPTDTVEKPRYIWMDAASNFRDWENNKENIKRDLTLVKNAGFTDVIVDVRSTTGDVLYKSDTEQQVRFFYAWVEKPTGGYEFKPVYRTGTWDYLQAFIDLSHELGLRIHAGFNTFTGGAYNEGRLFRDAEKAKTWATQINTANGIVNVMDVPELSEKFLNPANSEVQKYLCDLLADLAKYDLDGIILDRGRYLDIRSDFSEESHQQFLSHIGTSCNWPDDVLPLGSNNTPQPTPKYFYRWLEYRAKVIYQFMSRARNAVKAVNSNIKFGVYVGAWYGSYYDVGVNWAGKGYDPSKDYWWATKEYKDWGYAGLMDQIVLGAYASPLRVTGTTEWTIQGFCTLGKAKTAGECPLVIGGPDVGNWSLDGVTEQQELSAVKNSVNAAMRGCDGYFLFDIIHLKLNPKKWDAVQAGIDNYLKTVKKK